MYARGRSPVLIGKSLYHLEHGTTSPNSAAVKIAIVVVVLRALAMCSKKRAQISAQSAND